MTRRKFVAKTMATGAVIAGAPAFLRGQNLNSKLNIAFIACGGRANASLSELTIVPGRTAPKSKAASDTGGGYLVGWVAAGEWLNYTVNVAVAGTYAIDLRVASNGAGGTFHIEVNGVNKTGAISVPSTGGWQTWQTITKTGVTLSAGQQVIRVVMDSIGASGAVANFNWFGIR